MPKGICPECECEVQVGSNDSTGDFVECEDCGTKLELVGLDPIEFDMVEEEDGDDEDDY